MVKSVILPLAPRAAFELFTQKSGNGGLRTGATPRIRRARYFCSKVDGSTNAHAMGTRWSSATFDPGNSRAVFCSIFFIAIGPDKPTEVEITFAAQEGGTRVTVTHRPKPVSEGLWTERAPRYERSWDVVLAALCRAAA